MSETYDVAISYSHEDRDIARRITEALRARGIQVFFDEQVSADLWGQDLFQYLARIYEQSRLCIVIVSHSYTASQWASSELRSLLAHSRARDSFAIFPVTVGEVSSTLLDDVQHVQWSATGADHVAQLVEERLRTLPAPSRAREPENFHVIARESGWSVKRAGTSRAASVHRTRDEAIAAARAMAGRHRPSELVIHHEDGTIAAREVMQPEAGSADPEG